MADDPMTTLDIDDVQLDLWAALDIIVLAGKKAAALDPRLAEVAEHLDAALLALEAVRRKVPAPADVPDLAFLDGPPADRNGSHKEPVCPTVPIRKLATPPPPVRKPGEGMPACLAGLRPVALDALRKIAQALAPGRTHMDAILKKSGVSQPTAYKWLAELGHSLPPAERLFDRVGHGLYEVTDLGRKWLLG